MFHMITLRYDMLSIVIRKGLAKFTAAIGSRQSPSARAESSCYFVMVGSIASVAALQICKHWGRFWPLVIGDHREPEICPE